MQASLIKGRFGGFVGMKITKANAFVTGGAPALRALQRYGCYKKKAPDPCEVECLV